MPAVADDMQTLARKLVEPLRGWFLGYGSGYVSGTWTPTYIGGTAAGATTYTAQVGEWVRVGSVVHIWGQVSWSAATGTGDGRITLPFTARNTANAQYPAAIRINGLAYGGNFINGVVIAGVDYMILQSIAATTGAASTIAVDTGGATVAFSLTMPVD